jgi:hypothetical protein
MENKHKCEVYVQAKMIKKTFSGVIKNDDILDLTHSDICKLNKYITKEKINILLHSLIILNIHIFYQLADLSNLWLLPCLLVGWSFNISQIIFILLEGKN